MHSGAGPQPRAPPAGTPGNQEAVMVWPTLGWATVRQSDGLENLSDVKST